MKKLKNSYKKIIAGVTSLMLISAFSQSAIAESGAVDITVNSSNAVREISPYIYGVNSGVDMSKVTAGSFRLGGNRMSAYNWENNMSNAGADYKNMSDMYLISNAAEEFRSVPRRHCSGRG